MKLRNYQKNAADAIFQEWESGARSTLVVCPTGTGKTVLAAEIVKRTFPGRVLFLAHREELIFQAREKITRYTGLKCGIEMAGYKVDEQNNLWYMKDPVIVSSIQTQNAGGAGDGRMSKFNPEEFSVAIVDEAHHATASSYVRVLDYYKSNSKLKILGITATPDRADEEALGKIYDTVAYDYEISDAINDGWLVPITQRMVQVSELDFSQIRTTAGDLNSGDLAAVMEQEKMLHGIASPAIDIVGSRRALLFASSVKHAEMLAEIFNRHRPDMATWICAKTPKDSRRKILTEYAAGKIQVVCNCGVLTEGFDDPGVEVIIMGRPTKSRSLYSQMCGRSTRPLPGIVDGLDSPDDRREAIAASTKPYCEIVDFTGNAGRHKLMCSADILGGKYSDEVVDIAREEIRRSQKPENIEEILEKAEAEYQERKKREAAKKARLVIGAKYSQIFIDPFDLLNVKPGKARGWDQGKELTDKQKNLLIKQGINPEGMPFHEAKQLIGELFKRWDSGMCSIKQAALLRKYGLPTDVKREQASAWLDKIAKNNWRKPTDMEAVA
jgi:superfamily II DNA or RNA helicase